MARSPLRSEDAPPLPPLWAGVLACGALSPETLKRRL